MAFDNRRQFVIFVVEKQKENMFKAIMLLFIFFVAFIQPVNAKKINIGFDKFPILLDLADYQFNHTVLDKYYWCKFKLTIYF